MGRAGQESPEPPGSALWLGYRLAQPLPAFSLGVDDLT